MRYVNSPRSSVHMVTEVADPVVSSARDRRHAVIPPFSFEGPLAVGISGIWYPTATYQFTQASISSTTLGTPATIYILKEEPLNDPIVLGQIYLGANSRKNVINLDEPVVGPYDKVYMASFADSTHENVVIQLVGFMMS